MSRRFALIYLATLATLVPAVAFGALTLSGNVQFMSTLVITGSITKGSGSFVIDHPLDPSNKLLYHSFVESPDVKNIYDDIAMLDKNGEVTIVLPAYYDVLNKDSRYQFFALDQAMPDLYLKSEEKNNQFTIAGGKPNGRISWQITGIRHDPYILLHPIHVEVDKGSGQPVTKKGQYLFPDYEKYAQ